nr:ferritin-like domain-containing protein [Deltaproteobacteria bacterium]
KPAVHEAQQFALRGLFEVALENAVEGCVRETYGAVVGHHQARRAQDPVVRAAMAQVAEDETRHAALSWAVAEWALPRLTDAQREEIREAQRGAIDALARSVSIPESDALLHDAGLPAPSAALAMLQALGEQVWA